MFHETWRLSGQTSFKARKDFRVHHFTSTYHSGKIATQWYWITPFLFELQHCNVSLSFDKIQLPILKHSQSNNLISYVQLKNNTYQLIWNMFWYTSFRPQNSKSFRPFQHKIMFQSCFNIISISCFSHVSTFYQFHRNMLWYQ
jgi:hypothetical protein